MNNDLEQLIVLSKIVAKPWMIATVVLSLLLIISLSTNVYLATQSVELSFEADNNVKSVVNQTNR